MPNVKAGELAIVIRNDHTPALIGRPVRVIRPMVADELFTSVNGHPIRATQAPGLAWVVDAEGSLLPWQGASTLHQFIERPVRDSDLRPLRDRPGEDETLSWARRPAAVEA